MEVKLKKKGNLAKYTHLFALNGGECGLSYEGKWKAKADKKLQASQLNMLQ